MHRWAATAWMSDAGPAPRMARALPQEVICSFAIDVHVRRGCGEGRRNKGLSVQFHEAVQKHQVRPAIEVALAEVTGDQTCIGVRGVGIDHGKMQRPLLLAVGRQKDPAPAFGVAREVPRLLASADCAPDLRVVATELAVARHKPVKRHERDVSVDIEIDVNRIGNRTPARMADEEDPLQLVGLAVLVLLKFLNRLDHRSEPAIPS